MGRLFEGELRPDPTEAAVVKTAFNLVKEMTIQEVCEKSKELEFMKKNGKPVARSSLYRMFESQRIDIYLGNKYETPLLKEEDIPEQVMEKYLSWKSNSHQ
ncbi:recombinase family protein [Neobacillus pocheonensis]|uniref:Recombinase family protein n=1 Tax=Neobacillus pocheonensis TaxID=363869 RepID=A0ABT0WFS7_9BACI|nr:recombinase family protein [Neobacillus pocheonensis]